LPTGDARRVLLTRLVKFLTFVDDDGLNLTFAYLSFTASDDVTYKTFQTANWIAIWLLQG